MIRFGTDGWRDIIAENFTFENVGRVAQALAFTLKRKRQVNNGIAVSFDTRFLYDRFAGHFATVLASNEIPTFLSKHFTPTPVLSFTVKKKNLNAGVMITASHNPYYYNGIKFKASYGGPVLEDFTRKIEKNLINSPIKIDLKRVKQFLVITDFSEEYFDHLKNYLHSEKLSRFKGKIVYDAMHGCGIGFLGRILKEFNSDVDYLHHDENPLFNRKHPEPIPENLQELQKTIVENNAQIGFATDGDADRFGVLDEKGRFVQLHDLMPLLFEYLIRERGMDGDVVRTTSMSETIDRLASEYGKKVYEVPVGFKNVTEYMVKENILIGGEESGGFGFMNHIPERDGILSCLLTIEMLATYRKSISGLVRELRKKYGSFHYLRIDRYFDSDLLKSNLRRIRQNPPEHIAGQKIDRVNLIDGIKFYFISGVWMLIRVSQTEPLARIYVGGPDADLVKKIIKAGEKLIVSGQNN